MTSTHDTSSPQFSERHKLNISTHLRCLFWLFIGKNERIYRLSTSVWCCWWWKKVVNNKRKEHHAFVLTHPPLSVSSPSRWASRYVHHKAIPSKQTMVSHKETRFCHVFAAEIFVFAWTSVLLMLDYNLSFFEIKRVNIYEIILHIKCPDVCDKIWRQWNQIWDHIFNYTNTLLGLRTSGVITGVLIGTNFIRGW